MRRAMVVVAHAARHVPRARLVSCAPKDEPGMPPRLPRPLPVPLLHAEVTLSTRETYTLRKGDVRASESIESNGVADAV